MINSDLPRTFETVMQPYTGASHIAVAVSGGADSIALALLFKDWATKHDIDLTALTVDHGLRAESATEAKSVAHWMDRLDIRHVILTLDDLGPTCLQENARSARYEIMADYCRTHHITHLATGHHLDDQFETVLMRLARGSGLKGLCGIAMERNLQGITLLRPLLDIPKSDLIALCQHNKHPWVEDPSNRDLKYDRTVIRKHHAVLNNLGLTSNMLEKSRQKLQAAQDFIQFEVKKAEDFCVAADEGHSRIAYERFLDLHPYLQRALLEMLLKRHGGKSYPPKSASMDNLLKKIQGRGFNGATLHNCKISVSNSDLIIAAEN